MLFHVFTHSSNCTSHTGVPRETVDSRGEVVTRVELVTPLSVIREDREGALVYNTTLVPSSH